MDSLPILVACFLLIIYRVIVAEEVIRDITSVIENVQQLYLSRSMFIVYNQRQFDFDREKMLVEAIKVHSLQGFTSQAITYDNLNETSSPRRVDTLYSLLLYDKTDLNYAINATKKVDMSAHPWLLLLATTTKFNCDKPNETFFKLRMDTKITAKCQGNPVLKRYYSVIENHTEVANLSSHNVNDVETNMKGITLKLAKRRKANDEVNENNSKFITKVIRELASLGQFHTEVTIQEDRMGHINRKTGEWSGLMKIMQEGQADIGMVYFSLSNTRMNVVDFAIPMERARFYLYAKLPDSTKIQWNAYFKAFDKYTWIALGALIISFSILLCVINPDKISFFSFFQKFINVLGVFSRQGLSEDLPKVASQILAFSILFSSLFIHAIYSATITSYITQLTTDLPFSTYEEFLRDRNYKITVLKDSRDEDLFYEDDKQLPALRHRLKNHDELARNPYEGFNQACESNVVFYSDGVSYDGIKIPPCKLGSVNMRRMEHMSFILTKNSPYTRTISHLLIRLREHGILRRLKNKYFYKIMEIPGNEPNVITLEEILPILAILIVGVIASMFVWILEVVVHYCNATVRY